MTVSQLDFARALFAPGAPVPAGLLGPAGRPADRRFDVYRNNVASSLISALETAFPALRALLGTENFRRLATEHARRHPPRTPLLLEYGDEMPGFLAGFPPLKHLGYLPDLARLEIARRQSYHAADADPVDPAKIAGLREDRLLAARLAFAPAVRLIRSRWPVAAMRQAALDPNAPKPGAGGQNVLVARPDYDPTVTVLPPGGGTFLATLIDRRRIGEALETTFAAVPDFDLSTTLAILAAGAAVTGFSEDP